MSCSDLRTAVSLFDFLICYMSILYMFADCQTATFVAAFPRFGFIDNCRIASLSLRPFSGHELPARFHRFHARVEKESFSTRRTETGLYGPIGIKSNVRTLDHKPRSISNLGLRPPYIKHLGFVVSVRNY